MSTQWDPVPTTESPIISDFILTLLLDLSDCDESRQLVFSDARLAVASLVAAGAMCPLNGHLHTTDHPCACAHALQLRAVPRCTPRVSQWLGLVGRSGCALAALWTAGGD